MRNILLVAQRELWQHLRSHVFIAISLGLPALLIGIWALTGTLDGQQQGDSTLEKMAKAERPDLPVGYVDQSGFVRSLPPGIPNGLLVAFPDEAAAAAALAGQRIGAYYIVSPDYPQSGDVKRVSSRLPFIMADRRFFEWVLVWNLLPGRSPVEVARLRAPFDPQGLQFVPVSPQGLASSSQQDLGIAPFLVAMAVMMPLFMAGNYLMEGLAQEKENRVMEMLLVSLRPRQLLGGKLLGLGALTLLQFGAWLMVGGLILQVAGRDPGVLLSSIDISGSEPLLGTAFAIGGFLLYATLMAGLGAIAPNVEATRMWALVIGSPMLLPIMLWSSMIASPNGPLAVTLSIVPFSAPVGMLMRLMATAVPAWEVTLSLSLLVVTSVVMLLLMARVFRAGTLLSGQPLSLRRFWDATKP